MLTSYLALELLPPSVTAMGVIPVVAAGRGWLSGRSRPRDAPDSFARTDAARYDLSDPQNQRKLDAADALGGLADDRITLIQMALAFVVDPAGGDRRDHRPRTIESARPASAPTRSPSTPSCSTASTRSCLRHDRQRRRHLAGTRR